MIKIAIAEDQMFMRTLMIPWINNIEGCKVIIEARHGQEFIDKLQPDLLPDLVILDLNMPVKDGFVTADWISQNHPGMRVLVLTSLDSDVALLRLLKVGIRAFLLKDKLSADEMKVAISSVMETGYYYTGSKFFQAFRNLDTKTPWMASNLVTEVEMKFLRLASTALTYRAIAIEMGVSPRTVDGYRESLFKKLQVSTRVELALLSVRHGIIMV